MAKPLMCRLLLLFLCTVSNYLWGAEDYPLQDAQECRVRAGLPNFFSKLKQGGAVRIAYLGGSITAQPGWRPKSLNWFQQQFPQAEFSEINAAIGGTGSDLGVFRLQDHVLKHQPDLLFVEFAVNDGGAAPHRIHQAVEGIVRQTFAANPLTDICFVYTLRGDWTQTLRDGKFPRAASAMEAIADHYGIPSIHMGLQVAILEGQGKVIFKGPKPKTEAEKQALGSTILFSPDNVHPYPDTGHELYLQAIVCSMALIRKTGRAGAHRLPAPFVADHWGTAQMVPLSQVQRSPGWRQLDPGTHKLARRFSSRIPELHLSNRPGETIRFRFKGALLRVYDLLGPDCGQVIVRIDDRPAVTVARFDSYCTYHRLGSFTLARDLTDAWHRVVLELHPDQPDKVSLLAKRSNTMDNPERFDDQAWYAGAILAVGELQPLQ